MIGKVSGRLDYRGSDHVLIEAGGVGYVIYCSERTLALMPAPGGAVALYTEMVVREDLMQLFGFSTRVEKEWHRLLTTVQGVGAKAALAILGTLGPDGVSRAIALGDMSAIKSAPGIGPKIAQRVVLELKQKAPLIMAMGAGGAREATVSGKPETPVAPPPAQPAAAVAGGNNGAVADALSALINLGYTPGDAAGAVAEVNASDPEAETPALIRAALKLLAPKG